MGSNQSKRQGDNGSDVPKNGNGNDDGGQVKKQDSPSGLANTPVADTPRVDGGGRSSPPVVPGTSGTPAAGGGGTSNVGGGTVRTQPSGGNGDGGGNIVVSTPPEGRETTSSYLPTPTSTSITISSTSLKTSVTGESNYRSTSRELPAISSSQPMASIRYTTDPSGNTQIVTIGVEPSGISSTTSRSGANAGVITGVVILILFIFFTIGFLLYRRRVRRRNRIAPSAQYLADYGPRPLSWGRTFFKRRGSSQYYDISQPNTGPNFQSGHTTGPEMRESQSQTGHINVSTQSISGKTSIGAVVGHSPVSHDNPFDDPDIQISTISGH